MPNSSQTPAELQEIFGDSTAFTISEDHPGFPIIEVNAGRSTAQIALQGAQVLSWLPTDHPDVLYTSPKAMMELKPGTAVRGGIPICWPWFNAHPEDDSKPNHGFVRNRFWQLESAEFEYNVATLVFKFFPCDETRALWPHEFELTATIKVSDKLKVRLATKNTGEEAFQITSALHTYLGVGDIDRIQLEGVKGSHYIDQLLPADAEEVYQEKNVIINEEIDRIYSSMSSLLLRDLDRGRAVFVDKAGSRSTVVWNPWIEKSKTLKDLPNNDYKEFVCIEAANAGRDKPTVRPNSSHTLETTIGLRPLQ